MLVEGVWTESNVAESSRESFSWVDAGLLEDGENLLHFQLVLGKLQEVDKVLLADTQHRLIVGDHNSQDLLVDGADLPVWRNGRDDGARFARQLKECTLGGVKNTIRRLQAWSTIEWSTSCRQWLR